MEFATSLVMGERIVEIPGRYSPFEAPSRHGPIVHPDLRAIRGYATAPCKHERAALKQSRHVRQAHEVWRDGTVMQRSFMLSRAGQCGIDTAMTTYNDMEAVASLDRPANYSHMDLGESIMYFVATLQLHGLPCDDDSCASLDPPTVCTVCNAAMCDPLQSEPYAHTGVHLEVTHGYMRWRWQMHTSARSDKIGH